MFRPFLRGGGRVSGPNFGINSAELARHGPNLGRFRPMLGLSAKFDQQLPDLSNIRMDSTELGSQMCACVQVRPGFDQIRTKLARNRPNLVFRIFQRRVLSGPPKRGDVQPRGGRRAGENLHIVGQTRHVLGKSGVSAICPRHTRKTNVATEPGTPLRRPQNKITGKKTCCFWKRSRSGQAPPQGWGGGLGFGWHGLGSGFFFGLGADIGVGFDNVRGAPIN